MIKAVRIAAIAAAISGAFVSIAGAQVTDLTGAGSSFAYPIYSKWASMYAAKTGVHVNYQSIGSSGGIRQLSDEIVDFGATDGPMTDEQLAKAKGGPILHFPTVLGGVALTYNLPTVTQPLKLTGEVIADMFMGTITKWNDPRIAQLNPGVRIPSADVIVVHRTDGSGTTYIFSDYLSSVSPAWLSKVGRGRASTGRLDSVEREAKA